MDWGDYHSFPEEVTSFGSNGQKETLIWGDGIKRTEVKIYGSYRGHEGYFDYIIEPDGTTCNHRLFVPVSE